MALTGRSLGDIIRAALPTANLQILFECMTSAQARRKPAGTTAITFLTPYMTPDDVLWFTGELGRPDTRKPKYVGVIVWVPVEIYEGK